MVDHHTSFSLWVLEMVVELTPHFFLSLAHLPGPILLSLARQTRRIMTPLPDLLQEIIIPRCILTMVKIFIIHILSTLTRNDVSYCPILLILSVLFKNNQSWLIWGL